jgi:GntR family transcriptional regulator/MocR family aminotransferase
MAIWLDTGKSIVGLKEKLLVKKVYLQTEVEFNILKELPECDYRFIRLGFAAMNEVEVARGLEIVMSVLYDEAN